jgi:MFS family permease
MRAILKQRPLRLVFAANLVSMLGSGMNSAAVTWYILQATHNEMALGNLIMLTTVPAILMLPFTGVIIDREDRRRVVMLLDLARGLVILTVAVLALHHRVQIWQLYCMNTLVAAGFWMFWPTITALIQELTPEAAFVHSNAFLMAGVQGGWLIAGSIVGFVYNHIGLSGVLFIDCATYVLSFCCYLFVRSGKHIVKRPEHHLSDDLLAAETAVARFSRELREGVQHVRQSRYLLLTGIAWSLFIGAMMTQNVLTAPLTDRILHAGAVGYGWLNASWGVGAFIGSLFAARLIRGISARRAIALCMSIMAACLYGLPASRWLALSALLYWIMGSARGTGGVAISTAIMEIVPPHFMGRVQNTFLFIGTCLQIALAGGVGFVAHNVALSGGFIIVGCVYAAAALMCVLPAQRPALIAPATSTATAD